MALSYASGPWEVKHTLQIVQKGALPGDKAICYCGDREEIEANAAAIAAMPDLLEAAEKLLQAMRRQSKIHPSLMYTTPGWVELQRAINKAKGERS